MPSIKFWLVLLLNSVFTLQCSPEQYRKMNQFSGELLSRVTRMKPNENIAIATASVWSNLMLLSQLAVGETRKELMKLQVQNRRCRRTFYKRLMSRFKMEAYNLRALRDGVMFVDKNMTRDFITKVRLDNGVLLIAVDEKTIDRAVEASNALISTATRHLVNDAVTKSFLENIAIRMLDVSVFKASFEVPLGTYSKGKMDFNDENGLYLGEVKSMNKTGKFKLENLSMGCAIIEILVPSARSFSIVVFLPHMGITVDTVIHRLRHEHVENVFTTLRNSDFRTVSLTIPRFKVTTRTVLNEHLQRMGLGKMFEQNLAEFPSAGGVGYHVSQVQHYADFELIEEEVDQVQDESTEHSNVFSFKVDRPFLFIVVEQKRQVIVHAGVFLDPTGT